LRGRIASTPALGSGDTADSASVALADELARLNGEGAEIERFDVGEIGDDAHPQVNRTPEVYTTVLPRVDRLVVSIFVPLGLADEDGRADALRLAQKLTQKIEAVIQS
jgi:hypothetical protein